MESWYFFVQETTIARLALETFKSTFRFYTCTRDIFNTLHNYLLCAYVRPCLAPVKFSILCLAWGKAGPIMKADKKHNKKVALLKLRTYAYNSCTYKHFHLPQVTNKQLPWQDSS